MYPVRDYKGYLAPSFPTKNQPVICVDAGCMRGFDLHHAETPNPYFANPSHSGHSTHKPWDYSIPDDNPY